MSAWQEEEQVKTPSARRPKSIETAWGGHWTRPKTVLVKTNCKLRTNRKVNNGPWDRAGGKTGRRNIATWKPSRASNELVQPEH